MKIDIGKKVGEISPLLFGHNLEHTRMCVWRGLGAQLLGGRKFTGVVDGEGLAAPWYRIGPPACTHMVERARGRWGLQGEPYTGHFDPNFDPPGQVTRCQRIQSFTDAAPSGLGQKGIFLAAGKEYEGWLALRSEGELPVCIRISAGSRDDVCFETTLGAGDGEWHEHSFRFTSPVRDEDARLEITFTGPGLIWVGAVSLLPADHFLGMRSDVIELLKEISVPIMRWPGGNFAGSYRWKDGLLPVGRRAPLPGAGILPYTGGYDDHEIGTDEFVALCREIGAEPWITINMGREGADQAAAWVEYCNGSRETKWGALRAECGHPEPYGVRYWSLGNEMGYGHMRGPNAPEEYGRAAAACSEAMRRVDPSIVLVASGTWWREEWFAEVLAKYGSCFDHLAYHEYTALIKDCAGPAASAEFRRIAAAPGRCTLDALKKLRARADACTPGGKSVGISFDEWNVWHTWFRRPGVAEGIHAAAMLNMFCREAHRIGMTMGAYFEPVNEGAIRVEPDAAHLTPAGRVFSLFRCHHGNQALETDPPSAGADLDVAASLNEKRGELSITMVNRSPEADVRADFALENSGGIRAVAGRALTAPDFLPGTEFTDEEAEIALKGDRALEVRAPKHSVVAVRLQVTGPSS